MRTGILVLVAAMAMVSSCSGSPPATAPKVPVFSTSAPPSSAREREVPKTCGGIATLAEVTQILNAAVTGQTLPIVGVPEPKIGRTARLDCYYGVPDGQPVTAAVLTVGLASYTDEQAAERRMASTVETEREAGAKANDVSVGSDRGVLLNGTKRTLVAVRGRNTVVVTANPDLVAEDQAGSLLARLADRALSPR